MRRFFTVSGSANKSSGFNRNPPSSARKSCLSLLLFFLTLFLSAEGQLEEGIKKGKLPDYRIACIGAGYNQTFWQAAKQGCSEAASALGIRCTFEGTATEALANVQANMLENALISRADGVLLSPIDASILIPSVNKLRNQGIPVLTFHSKLGSSAELSHIGTDYFKAGREAAERIAELIGRRGKIVYISDIDDSLSRLALKRGFAEKIESEYPSISIAAELDGGGFIRTSVELIKKALSEEPDIRAFFTGDPGSTMASVLATEETAAAKDRTTIIGFGYSEQSAEMLREGKIDGFFIERPYSMTYQGLKLLTAHLQGERIPENIDTGITFVNKDIIDSKEIRDLLYPF